MSLYYGHWFVVQYPYIKGLHVYSCVATCNRISYGTSRGWEKECLFQQHWSHDQYGNHAYFLANLKNLLQNEKADGLAYSSIIKIGHDDPGLTLTILTARSVFLTISYGASKGQGTASLFTQSQSHDQHGLCPPILLKLLNISRTE